MKVRHHSNGYRDWKVLEESDTFYIVEGDFAPLALKKLEYEPVQEWVDVTGIHEGGAVAQLLQDPCYRLVRHDVGNLHKQFKAYAYLLEKVKR